MELKWGRWCGLASGLWQVCRVKMIVRVRNKIYGGLSVSRTRVGNIGGVEKEEKAKSVVQVMNANRGKNNEVWSVGRYVKIRNEELGMSSQQGKGYTGAGLARRSPEVVNPGAPEDPETTPL